MGAPFPPPEKKPEVLSFVRTLILNEKNPDLSADDGAAEREKEIATSVLYLFGHRLQAPSKEKRGEL